MSEKYPIPSTIKSPHVNAQDYQRLYEKSCGNPEAYWAEVAQKTLDWSHPWDRVKNVRFEKDVSISWFESATLNASVNCLDRHLATKKNDTAIIWEPDNPKEEAKSFTYGELHESVCRMANILKKHGVKKGDRVTLYLPMIPEAAFAMLACARIGATHSVVFAGFSAESLAGRINDCQSDFVITSNVGIRGGKSIPLKENVDRAAKKCPGLRKVLLIQRDETPLSIDEKRDLLYEKELQTVDAHCPPEIVDAEHPLFILYTSGSTGKPKGLVHSTGGYLLYAAHTHKLVFDYKPGQIYWCTADVGWITGHSYIIYGPLCNGATTLMFEGTPTYPTPSRHWEVVDKHQVEIYYTAPTAIRALMCEGEKPLESTSRRSLKILGSVGEPINPEAWRWYYNHVGQSRCPIVDTWWQTETGGILISPLPGATELKPGSATHPLFGILPCLVDESGRELEGESKGHLCLKDSWPGQARTIFGDHARFVETYFSQYPGKYFSGDECQRDSEGYYWILGRADDVINVSGHRMGTAEVESALVAHPDVSEAAVVGFPHAIKGQGIFAYVTLNKGVDEAQDWNATLRDWVSQEIGPIAKPEHILISPVLPKTRSGKIMRRILRKIADKDYTDFGDISTLADSSAVETIIDRAKAL